MRRRVGGMNAPSMMEMTGEGQSDAQFWASNANNHAGNSGMGSMDDDDMGGMGDFFPEDDDGSLLSLFLRISTTTNYRFF